MSEYDSNDHGRCPECDGTDGNHYPGCLYEGTGGSRKYIFRIRGVNENE